VRLCGNTSDRLSRPEKFQKSNRHRECSAASGAGPPFAPGRPPSRVQRSTTGLSDPKGPSSFGVPLCRVHMQGKSDRLGRYLTAFPDASMQHFVRYLTKVSFARSRLNLPRQRDMTCRHGKTGLASWSSCLPTGCEAIATKPNYELKDPSYWALTFNRDGGFVWAHVPIVVSAAFKTLTHQLGRL